MSGGDRLSRDPKSIINRCLRGLGAFIIASALLSIVNDWVPAGVSRGWLLGGIWLGMFLLLEVASPLAAKPRDEIPDPVPPAPAPEPEPSGDPEGLPPDRPDLKVDIVALRDVVAEPNPEDDRYARFVAWTGDDPECAPAGSVPSHARRDPTLRGHVAVASFFIGRDGTMWTDREIMTAHRALERAGKWIEAEALRWDARVNVDVLRVYFAAEDPATTEVEIAYAAEDDHDPFHEAHATTNAIASASRAATRCGSPDFIEMGRKVRDRVNCDHLVWLLHPRRAGQSHAIPPSLTPIPGVHLAECYVRETKFSEPLGKGVPPFPDPVTFVHELLHLFGATDKYDRPLSAFARGEVTERDVMALHFTSLPRLRVDRLTAREIGWLD